MVKSPLLLLSPLLRLQLKRPHLLLRLHLLLPQPATHPLLHLQLLHLLPATPLPQPSKLKGWNKKAGASRLFLFHYLPPAESFHLAGDSYPFFIAVHRPGQRVSCMSRRVVFLAEMGRDDMLQPALIDS